MERETARTYLFGRYRLDLARRCLIGDDGNVMALSGRGYDVLAYLLEHRHRVVSKDELMKAVWPKVVVEENSLTQAISHARRALGDTRESPQFIATVADAATSSSATRWRRMTAARHRSRAQPSIQPRMRPRPASSGLGLHAGPPGVVARGGRGRGRGRRRMVARPVGHTGIESIAVLPFKPLAGSTRDEAIEMGVAELLINRLSSHEGIVVRPLSSVIAFAGPTQDPLAAGRSLAVDAVVDGYVQLRDERIASPRDCSTPATAAHLVGQFHRADAGHLRGAGRARDPHRIARSETKVDAP